MVVAVAEAVAVAEVATVVIAETGATAAIAGNDSV
jgi:hypothetical protein